MTKSERNYCVTRQELLAIVWFTEYFKHYLVGNQFLLRTDHGSLRWLFGFKDPEGQMARWLERLSRFNFDIEHRPGKKHGNCDGLSRIPCEGKCRNCMKGHEMEMEGTGKVRRIRATTVERKIKQHGENQNSLLCSLNYRTSTKAVCLYAECVGKSSRRGGTREGMRRLCMGARASRVWGVGGRARGRSPSRSTTRLARDGEPPPQQQQSAASPRKS